MKKVIAGLLTMVFVVGMLSGCSSRAEESSSNVSDNTKKVAEQAITVLDDYLDLNITAKEAEEKMERLQQRLDSNDDRFIVTTMTLVKSYLSTLAWEELKAQAGASVTTGEKDKKILEQRNALAKKAGLKER